MAEKVQWEGLLVCPGSRRVTQPSPAVRGQVHGLPVIAAGAVP